jgi:CheY-like chemotaxis protein
MGADDAERPSSRRARKAILLVEDDDASRLVIRVMLEAHGYRVFEAATPSRARELLAGDPGRIDLLLCDVKLPEMRGEALAEELCRSRPALRVVFMSGLAGSSDSSWPFVRKPIDLDDLVGVLEQSLSPS